MRDPYNKLLTNLASSSRTGEYWPLVVFARTSLRSVHTATTSGHYSPVRPSRSVSKWLIDLKYLIKNKSCSRDVARQSWGARAPPPPPSFVSLFKQTACSRCRGRHDNLMSNLTLTQCDPPLPSLEKSRIQPCASQMKRQSRVNMLSTLTLH